MEETWQVRCKTAKKNPMDRYDRKLKQELVSAIGPRTVGKTFMIIIFFLSFFSAPLSLRRGPHSQRHTHTRTYLPPLVWETHREREGEWIFIHLVAAILSLSLSLQFPLVYIAPAAVVSNIAK